MAHAELFLYLVLTLAALVLVLTLVWAAVRELISLGVERREASRLGWAPVDLPMPAPVSDWGTPEAERAMWRRLAVHRAHPWTPGERGWPSTCRRCRTGCSSPRNVADGRWSTILPAHGRPVREHRPEVPGGEPRGRRGRGIRFAGRCASRSA